MTTLDTSTFPAYLNSLGLTGPVNTRPGRLIPGPPRSVLEVALRFGLGPLLFDNPRNRALLATVGVDPAQARTALGRLRNCAMWLPVLEDLAQPHITAATALAEQGEKAGAIEKLRAALMILYLAMAGDGYYFYTPMEERRRLLAPMRRLYRLLRAMLGARTETLVVKHQGEAVRGLLHLPPQARTARAKTIPALLAFHPLGSDKESYDSFLTHFHAAGYATLCLDLPAHGERFDGPRLQPDVETLGVAALDVLARHPAIDAGRLGVMGGSLGAFFAQRTAAASPRVKACLSYASPFDLGYRLDEALPGVEDCFGWVVGAASRADLRAAAQRFHLRDVVEAITCPVAVVHGTQDHICDFTVSYEIASRLKAPVTVLPLLGVDHDAALPATPELAQPGIDWLKEHL